MVNMTEKQLLFIIATLFCNVLAIQSAEGNILSEDGLKDHLLKYITKTQSEEDVLEFNRIVDILKPPSYVLRTPFTDFSVGRQTITCVTCRSVLDTVKKLYLEDGYTEERMVEVISDLCILLQIQPENICRGTISGHLPIILYIIANQPNFKSESFCGLTFQYADPDTCPYTDENYEYTIDLPPKNVSVQPAEPSGETFKVIHVSDLHYDPAYEAFGLADCNEPTCCRLGQTEQTSSRWLPSYDDSSLIEKVHLDSDGKFQIDLSFAEDIDQLKRDFVPIKRNDIPLSKQAGFWGDFRHCDAPWWAIEDSIDHIVENIDLDDYDLIYHTGDIIDHGVWELSKELVQESIAETARKMKSAFGDKLVLNAVGNHESDIVNQFAPPSVTDPNFSSSWMYNMLIEEWGYWLPESTHASIRQGGFFSILVKPGFRVVVINNNICYRQNWWVHMEPKDPSGQLAWLVETLYESELNGELVHILAHLPPGRADCMQVYTREYRRIMERFADTVVAEFNGHTHKDEFKIYYEKDNLDNPYLVAWNGGSVTANAYVNPNYKVLEIDTNTYDVIDTDVWIFNLTEANLTPDVRPRWFKEYSFREHFGVPDMSAKSMDELLTRMVTTEQSLLRHDFHIFRGKSSDPQIAYYCDDNCIRDILNVVSTTELYDNTKAQILWDIFDANNKK